MFIAADKAGIDDERTGRVQLGQKAVRINEAITEGQSRTAFPVRAAIGVPGARGAGIVRRNRGTDHVGVPKRIHRNTVGLVLLGAAEIRRVEERRAVGADLGYERILRKVARASGTWLQGMRGWEVGRRSAAGDESCAVRGHRNGVGAVDAGAAEVGGVRQDRIDDERKTGIVLAYLERHFVLALQHVAAVDRLFDALRLLVDHRLVQA